MHPQGQNQNLLLPTRDYKRNQGGKRESNNVPQDLCDPLQHTRIIQIEGMGNITVYIYLTNDLPGREDRNNDLGSCLNTTRNITIIAGDIRYNNRLFVNNC